MEYKKARFEITSKCDLSCKHCYRFSYWKWTLGLDLPTKEVIDIIDYLVDKWLKKVKLLWWEVFVRKDYYEILNYFTEKWVEIFLISNWLALTTDVLENIKKCNIKLLSISIEWPKDINNIIRWYNLDYEKLIENTLNSVKYFKVCISTTLQKENIDYIEDLFKMFEGVWIEYIHIPVFMARTKEEILESTKILWEDIKLLPYLWDNYFTNKDYVEKNLKVLKDLEKYKEKYWVKYLITPILEEWNIGDLYMKNMRLKYKLDCTFLKQPIINNNWDVQLCPFMRIKIWNIKENTLDEIYNTDKYKNLRNKIYENNLLPVCERCCWLEVKKTL